MNPGIFFDALTIPASSRELQTNANTANPTDCQGLQGRTLAIIHSPLMQREMDSFPPTMRNCLRSLLSLERPALTSPLGSLGTTLSVEEPVPPRERARVVADELLVVNIVVVSAGPDG